MRHSPKTRTTPATLLTALLLLTAAGCRSKAPAPPAEGSSREPQPVAQSSTPLDPATLGDITGVVRLAGKAPAPVRLDTSMDPGCITNPATPVFSEQYVVKGDRLANVYIYVKSGPPEAMNATPTPAAPVILDQKACVYIPHVIAVAVNQPVEFHNSDPTMHNIQTMNQIVGNTPLDASQGPHGKPLRKSFPKPESMISVRCNIHPWMQAFINVSATPWFAVTGPEGKFELKGLPPGDYLLGAVQEKLGEQEIKVTVKPKAAAQADVIFAIQ